MNGQLHESKKRVVNAFLGFSPPNIDFLADLEMSKNLKKSMSQVYCKHLNIYLHLLKHNLPYIILCHVTKKVSLPAKN